MNYKVHTLCIKGQFIAAPKSTQAKSNKKRLRKNLWCDKFLRKAKFFDGH